LLVGLVGANTAGDKTAVERAVTSAADSKSVFMAFQSDRIRS